MDKLASQLEILQSKILDSKYVRAVSTWFNALTERDQLIVKVLAGIIVAALFFAWVWQPLHKSNQAAHSSLASEMKFHAFMKDNAHKVSASAPSFNPAQGSILGTVNQLAKAKGIALKRFEPEGSNGLRVWLDKVEFNKAIDWLELLEAEKGIAVEQISIDKVSSGIVNIRVVLKS